MVWAVAMLFATWHESGLAELYSERLYHVPLLALARPLAAPAFEWLMAAAAIGGALVLLGLFTRLGITLVVAALGYVFAVDLLLFRNHLYLGLLLGLLLWLAPCSNTWSVRAWLRRRAGKPLSTTGSLACAQLIKAQVLIVYGFSVLNKLRRPFLDGFVLERELQLALRSSPLQSLFSRTGGTPPQLEGVLHSSATLAAISVLVVAAEAFITLGLPSRRLRPYALAVGLGLHTAIFLSMGIHVFGLLMVSSYALFFNRTGQTHAM